MAWYDYAGVPAALYSLGSKALGGKGLSGDLKSAYSWGQKRPGAPQIGQNPYMGQWDTLLGQLQQQASGQGPSLAENAYRQAHAQGLRDQMSMASGGSAGRARQAGMNMARANQGLAAGVSNARLQEQLAARQALQAALSGAGNAWFMPQQANLQAQIATPTNMQQLMNFMQQLAVSGGSIASKAATGGAV